MNIADIGFIINFVRLIINDYVGYLYFHDIISNISILVFCIIFFRFVIATVKLTREA